MCRGSIPHCGLMKCICNHEQSDHYMLVGQCFWSYNCDCMRFRARGAPGDSREPRRTGRNCARIAQGERARGAPTDGPPGRATSAETIFRCDQYIVCTVP